MLISKRNQTGLSHRQIESCLLAWQTLCEGKTVRELITSEATTFGLRTRFSENCNIVYLGADVYPGESVDANSRISMLACLAHELAHAERYELGFQRPITMPENLIDEAETSLHASFMAVLSAKDREDLIEDARDRLIQWLATKSTEELSNEKNRT
jgi:hypothetical protein